MGCLFLYNPESGKSKIQKKLPLIERELKSIFGEITVHATKSTEDLENSVREGADRFGAIVFSGGDGTFNHVLQGLGEKDVRLGYLPSGTANDVARSLGISKNVKKALKVIRAGRTEGIDCMRVNESHYAMYIAAAGAFTCVTYETPQKRKRRFGWAAYAAEGFKHFKFGSFPVTLVCNGERVKEECVLVLVMNGRSVAGFFANRHASMQDGTVEIAIIRRAKKAGFWGRLCSLFSIAHLFLFGFRVRKKDITKMTAKEVEIRTDDGVVWDFDGEKGNNGNVKIGMLPRRVKMFVPKKKKI